MLSPALAGRLRSRPHLAAGGAVLAGVCIGVGILAGWNPTLAVAAALGTALLLLAVNDLIFGVVAIVVVSFFDANATQAGGSPTLTKVTGLLVVVAGIAAVFKGDTHHWRRFVAGERGWILGLLASAFGVFVLWVTFSATWAAESQPALLALQRYLLNMALVAIVLVAVNDRRHALWVIGAFVVAAAGSTLYGLALVGSGPSGRFGSVLGDANYTAAVLLAAVVLAGGLLAAMPRVVASGGPRTWRGSRLSIWWVAVAASGLVCLAGLIATQSRGGLVAFALVLAAGAVFGGRLRRYVAAVALLTAAVAAVYVIGLAPTSRQHLENASSTGRSDLWRVALRMAEDHPITGVGAGNFPVVSIQYLNAPGVISRADLIVGKPKPVHDIYLEELAELGVVGLLSFATIAAVALWCAFAAAARFARQGDPMEGTARAAGIALIGVLGAGVFISGEFIKQFWFLVALGPALLLLTTRDAIAP